MKRLFRGKKTNMPEQHKYVVINNVTSAHDDVWTNNITLITECSKAPATFPVYLKPLVSEKIDVLMKMFPSLEWLAYLVGSYSNDKYEVTDLLVPKQTVSGGSVTNVNFTVPNGASIIGVMHSHHNMGAFFSGTDDEWINQNHNLSIVVSHNKMLGQIRWKTPCGGLKKVDADVIIDHDLKWDKEVFIENVKSVVGTVQQFGYTRSVVEDDHPLIRIQAQQQNFPLPKELCGVNDHIKKYMKVETVKDDEWQTPITEAADDKLTFEQEIALLEKDGMLSISKYD